MGEKRGMQALEAWCRQVTCGYNGVKVTNMTSSWKDGLAFCALVHHFRPDLIDFASLSAENVYHNNQLAFSVAENVLGIPALLDAEDMVNYVPDRLSIMTYLSQFYQVLAAPHSKGGSRMTVGLKRPAETVAGCDTTDSSSVTTGSPTPVKIFARQLENDGPSSRQQARRQSELCVSCQNAVFLAERLMVNGRLHHRVCFRCARCQSQLSLANYYETEQEQYCCETCPDEVVASSTTPAVVSTPDRATRVSCSSSATATTLEPIARQNEINSPKMEDRPSLQQQRRFLDSMVDPDPPVDPPPVENDPQEIQCPADVPEIVETIAVDDVVADEKCLEISNQVESTDEVVAPETIVVQQPTEEKTVESIASIPPDSDPPVIQVTTEDVNDSADVVVPKPRRRKSKRSTTPQKKVVPIEEYPEELNPFDDELPGTQDTPKKVVAAPKFSLNPFGSDEEDDEDNNSSDPGQSSGKVRPGRPPPPVLKSPPPPAANPSPSPKKRPAPAPPPPKPQRTPSLASAGEVATISRRKSAPPPPNPEANTTVSPVPAPRTVINVTPVPSPKPRHLSAISSSPESPDDCEKAQKDLSNLHLQCSVNKDSHGQWKRKKGPAPPRPSPQKRQLRKLPLKGVQQELDDIEIKQVELERQGVSLEQSIRSLTEPEDGSEPVSDGIQIEEMILQLFDLVNEKNELLRRQTELMYIRRQQRLEEEHAELEFQIRCLMERPNSEKTDEDRTREEELIERLVQVVHRRAEIVDCLEMDRRRQVEEDESIQQHLDVFNSRGAATAVAETVSPPSKTKSKSLKMIQSPIKLMKKDKQKKSKKNKADKVDVDKETDETEVANTSPSQSADVTSSPLKKEKDKTKAKSWFAK